MSGERGVVDLTKSDIRFLRSLEREFGTRELNYCFQCGVCTASCPVREFESVFNPRRIMKLAKLGLKDEVYNNAFIWLCSLCFMCQERCPQDVRPPEVMTVLRNMAAKEGVAPPNIMKIVEVLRRDGRVYTIDDFTEEEREERGLPDIQGDAEFNRRISGG